METYKAAVLYDFTRHRDQLGEKFPLTVLVADLDRCALGICQCGENGTAAVLDQISLPQPRPLDQVWLEGLTGEPEALRTALTSEAFRRAFQAYCQAGRRLEPEGSPLSCRQAGEAFAPVRAALEALLNQGLDRLEQLGVDEASVRILAVGWLADCAPAQLALREVLCFDPFLPDGRFAALGEGERAASIVEEGRKLLEQSRTAGVDVSLLWTDGQGREGTPIPLAERGQPLSTLEQPRYSPPVFSAGEALRFQAGDQALEAPLPEGGPALVQAACGTRDGRLVILVRRAEEPDRIWTEIPVP